MASEQNISRDEKAVQTLEEICENTRGIRRVVNRILDHLHESQETEDDYDYDPDTLSWKDLYNHDHIYC